MGKFPAHRQMKLAFELLDAPPVGSGEGWLRLLAGALFFFLGFASLLRRSINCVRRFSSRCRRPISWRWLDLLVDADQHCFARLLVFFQLNFLTRLLRFDLLQLGTFFLVKLGELPGVFQVVHEFSIRAARARDR